MRKTITLPEYKQLCKILVEARHALGMHQTVLAKKLRKPQSFVSKVEAAQRRLDIFEFLTYARMLNLDPFKVLKQIDPEAIKQKTSPNQRKSS